MNVLLQWSILDPCKGVSCTGNVDTCSMPLGICKCGTNSPCNGNSDSCSEGKCMCGYNSPCNTTTDTCSNGECKCGITYPCVEGESCIDGVCNNGGSNEVTTSLTTTETYNVQGYILMLQSN